MKALGGVVRALFVLFILGLLGYNTYEIARLRAEVAALRGGNGKSELVAQTSSSGAMEQIAEAWSHAERASALLKEKKLSEAAKEMQLASDSAARATANAQATSRSTVVGVQKSLSRLSEQTAALWRQAEAATKTAREAGGVEKSAPPETKKDDTQQTNKK